VQLGKHHCGGLCHGEAHTSSHNGQEGHLDPCTSTVMFSESMERMPWGSVLETKALIAPKGGVGKGVQGVLGRTCPLGWRLLIPSLLWLPDYVVPVSCNPLRRFILRSQLPTQKAQKVAEKRCHARGGHAGTHAACAKPCTSDGILKPSHRFWALVGLRSAVDADERDLLRNQQARLDGVDYVQVVGEDQRFGSGGQDLAA